MLTYKKRKNNNKYYILAKDVVSVEDSFSNFAQPAAGWK